MNIAVIGSGFAGLSAASYLAKAGHSVRIVEKNDTIGGRCRQFTHEGFKFDMGPSWYWMPEVFEKFFNDFGFKQSSFYNLVRLDPSYSIYFDDGKENIEADLNKLKNWFDQIEPNSSSKLEAFLKDAELKYEAGMNKFIQKPSISVSEFVDFELLSGLFKMDLLKSFSKHVRKYFKHPKLIQLLEFPVLFLGATPKEIPALYSLMNFADIVGGTWYPMGGMYEVIEAMEKVCVANGVNITTNANVSKIVVNDASKNATGLIINDVYEEFDLIVASSDYHHTEQLLPKEYRNYSESYWDKRKMAPSCLLFYVGINKRVSNIEHHSLFFDADFDKHSNEIYSTPKWPETPLFYVCAPSVTDPTVAPENHENLFFLIPIAPDLNDSEVQREEAFQKILKRFEEKTGNSIADHIVYKKSYCVSDFKEDYNAFKGNAYGLANTLNQTAILKPKLINKKVSNLFYTGQLTVPGPGVPPSIISGKLVAELINKKFKSNSIHI